MRREATAACRWTKSASEHLTRDCPPGDLRSCSGKYHTRVVGYRQSPCGKCGVPSRDSLGSLQGLAILAAPVPPVTLWQH
jgi:hypothetical protein